MARRAVLQRASREGGRATRVWESSAAGWGKSGAMSLSTGESETLVRKGRSLRRRSSLLEKRVVVVVVGAGGEGIEDGSSSISVGSGVEGPYAEELEVGEELVEVDGLGAEGMWIL
jgi:hypothetical protein